MIKPKLMSYLFVLIYGMSFHAYANDDKDGVILMYHHVSSTTPPSTSISPENFTEHMMYLSQHHSVVSLETMINNLKSDTPLPVNAVAITFDDGFADIFTSAHPILKELDFPYTVFINPDVIGKRKDQLSWKQVAIMQNNGALFANHTLGHIHLLNRLDGETNEQWLSRIWENIATAEQIIEDKTGTSLKYLAYPFGEFDAPIQQKLSENGFIAFGQHSGVVNKNSDFTALPRFPAAGIYANIKTLKTKLRSLAYDNVSSSVTSPVFKQNISPGIVTLNLAGNDHRTKQTSCFFQGQPLPLKIVGNQIQFTIENPLPVGRSRVNCTSPSNQYKGRYYWFSQPFFVADHNGLFPN